MFGILHRLNWPLFNGNRQLLRPAQPNTDVRADTATLDLDLNVGLGSRVFALCPCEKARIHVWVPSKRPRIERFHTAWGFCSRGCGTQVHVLVYADGGILLKVYQRTGNSATWLTTPTAEDEFIPERDMAEFPRGVIPLNRFPVKLSTHLRELT
jgi:hypothetical protein